MAEATIRERIIPIRIDLTGKRFERLTVLSYRGSDHRSKSRWNCRCDCGKDTIAYGFNLTNGHTRSCGCINVEQCLTKAIKHGMESHPAYSVWAGLKQRCSDMSNLNYGGRGIRVCERWCESFESFWEDMGPTYQRGLSIDRENNNGNYEPNNCRWATALQQQRNRRNNRIIQTPLGAMPVSEAAEKSGINHHTLYGRANSNYGVDEILKPLAHTAYPKASMVNTPDGPMRFSAACRHFHIKTSTLRNRIIRGWPEKDWFSKENHRQIRRS